MESTDATLFVVDDEHLIRSSVALLAQALGVACQTFESAEEFLDFYQPSLIGCLLVDLRLGGMSGIELHEKLVERGSTIPVILFSAFANVDIAVRAMQQGAMTVIEKPYCENKLSDVIVDALEKARKTAKKQAIINDLRKRIERLSDRERDVMQRVVAGEANKVIAHNLDLSMRTVARLRRSVFDKLGCDSAVEATRFVATLEVVERGDDTISPLLSDDSP